MVVGCAIGKVSMEAVSKSILVFYIPMMIVLGLVTYIPAFSLWLPKLLLGKKPRRDTAKQNARSARTGRFAFGDWNSSLRSSLISPAY